MEFQAPQQIAWSVGALYWQTFIFMILFYLAGSINFGKVLSYFGKIDLGKEGSKNYGATNAGRLYGSKGFLFVFFADFLKGWLALAIILPLHYNANWIYGSITFSAMFVAIGHMWPVYFGFKGGKGIATSFGVFLALNWILWLSGAAIYGLLILMYRRVALASIISPFFVAVSSIFFPFISSPFLFVWAMNWGFVITSFIVSFLILYRHTTNIKNIAKGKESYVYGVKEFRDTVKNKTISTFNKNNK